MTFWAIVLVLLGILLGVAWWHDRRRRGQVGDLTGRANGLRESSRSDVQQYTAGNPSGFGGGGGGS